MNYKLILLVLTMMQCTLFGTVQMKILVFGGKTGWIGQKIIKSIVELGHIAIAAEARLENRTQIEEELSTIQPDFIINAAGVIGRPNVDWVEDHKQETVRTNIIGTLNLIDIAYLHNIHVTNIGTGCIYNYDDAHPMFSGKGFTEEDEPNFENAFYSKTKIMVEKILLHYPNVLHLRVRLPIAADFYRYNLIIKLTKYKKVVNIPNSVTILDDLIPIAIQMALRKLTGVYNFTNPGVISHNEILELYKEYLDPSFTYQNFTLAEQAQILKAGRSYNELDVSKLLTEFPEIAPVKHSIRNIFKKMKELAIEQNIKLDTKIRINILL